MSADVQLDMEDLLVLTSLKEVFGGFAHEMAQPLNAIMIASQVMQLRAQRAELPPAELEFFLQRLELVSSQVARATEILDGLRSFGQKDRPSSTETNLCEIFERVHGLMGQQFVSRGIDLDWEALNEPPSIRDDRHVVESLVAHALGVARDTVLETARRHEQESLPYDMKLSVRLFGKEGASVLEVTRPKGTLPSEESTAAALNNGGTLVAKAVLEARGGRFSITETSIELTLPH